MYKRQIEADQGRANPEYPNLHRAAQDNLDLAAAASGSGDAQKALNSHLELERSHVAMLLQKVQELEANNAALSTKVEEKFHKEKFRVLSEMRILAKIRVVILDFGRVSIFFWRNLARNRILGFRGEGN